MVGMQTLESYEQTCKERGRSSSRLAVVTLFSHVRSKLNKQYMAIVLVACCLVAVCGFVKMVDKLEVQDLRISN